MTKIKIGKLRDQGKQIGYEEEGIIRRNKRHCPCPQGDYSLGRKLNLKIV